METFPKGRNPDPLGTHVSHNRLNISSVQTHPVPEGQTKSPFGHTRREIPHMLGYTTATNSLGTPLDGPEYTPQYTWPGHKGNVPEGQKSGPFRNTRQPQPTEHKRCTDTPRSRRADKISLWAHQTGHTTATHSLSAQRSRSSIAFAKIDH